MGRFLPCKVFIIKIFSLKGQLNKKISSPTPHRGNTSNLTTMRSFKPILSSRSGLSPKLPSGKILNKHLDQKGAKLENMGKLEKLLKIRMASPPQQTPFSPVAGAKTWERSKFTPGSSPRKAKMGRTGNIPKMAKISPSGGINKGEFRNLHNFSNSRNNRSPIFKNFRNLKSNQKIKTKNGFGNSRLFFQEGPRGKTLNSKIMFY